MKNREAMTDERALPPGQIESVDFPPFGLLQFANRMPQKVRSLSIRIGGDVDHSVVLQTEFDSLERVTQVSDFHCVTTWTYRGLTWSGFRFSDFYRNLVVPHAGPSRDAVHVIFKSRDGYSTSLLLEDLMNSNVLLADRLNGQPLSLEHGAPIRLVAPDHYGYKNPKYIARIEFWKDGRHETPAGFRFMSHPRARVALEERGLWFPGWFLRYLYRPLIGLTKRRFHRAVSK